MAYFLFKIIAYVYLLITWNADCNQSYFFVGAVILLCYVILQKKCLLLVLKQLNQLGLYWDPVYVAK